MDMMVLSGKVSGSVIIADKVYVKLSMPIEGGEVYISDGECSEIYPMNSNKMDIVTSIACIDRCMLVDGDGAILTSGVLHGGITKHSMYADYAKLKEKAEKSKDIEIDSVHNDIDDLTAESIVDNNQITENNTLKINTSSDDNSIDIVDKVNVDSGYIVDKDVSNNTIIERLESVGVNTQINQENELKINTNSDDGNIEAIDASNIDSLSSIDEDISNIEVGESVERIEYDTQTNKNNQSKIVTSSESMQNFFGKVHSDVESMFATFTHNATLEDMVYESEWIDVPYQDSYYVVGVIKDKGTPAIIAYGIPCESYDTAKANYADYDWLPTDRENIDGKGYCLRYQNAIDGSMIDGAI